MKTRWSEEGDNKVEMLKRMERRRWREEDDEEKMMLKKMMNRRRC